MKIDELLSEAEKQSNIKIQSMITDTHEKMVLYDSLTSFDDVLEAAQEYYEYVLRLEVEVVHEIGKVIIRKPMVLVKQKEQPVLISKWPDAVSFEKQDLILGKSSSTMPSKNEGNFSDLVIKSKDAIKENQQEGVANRLSWAEFLKSLGRDKGHRRAGESEGYVLIRQREINENFKMIPDDNDMALLQEEGWTIAKIDELFKPTRIKERLVSSAIDGLVHIDAIREELWEDLVVIGEDGIGQEPFQLAEFDAPGDDFGLNTQLRFQEEVLPSHPKDKSRKPKWIMSLSPDSWLPKLEPHRHEPEKVKPVSRRVLSRRARSRAIFEAEQEAYDKIRHEKLDGKSRREKRD